MAKKKKGPFGFFWEDPWEELEKIHSRIHEVMRKFGEPMFGPKWRFEFGMPWFEKVLEKSFPIDVIDCPDKIIVRAELPGIAKKNISIRALGRMLEIKAEQVQEKREEAETVFRQERRYGRFYRTIPLPTEIEAEKAEASLEDGILEVVLPKKQKKEKHKEIKLK